MTFDEIVRMALDQKATDIHVEPKLPVVLRVNGSLRRTAAVLSREALQVTADRLLPDREWDAFQERGSYDLTRTISGVPCRINILKSDRGIGFAVRLLSTATNTLRNCNLHPQLAEYLDRDDGLILVTGPTGSGKSTTLSALLEEINAHSSKHIITLESPIEYRYQPKKSIIRQREVGVHTPSYEQGLMDSLREDPDVIVVGEMRESEAMRWTLNAAETGHLALATMHAANAADAVYRMAMSFPPERQSSVLAQLADSLVAIITQRMSFRPELGLLVPVLEILVGSHAVKNVIRKGEASKLQSLPQSGGVDGCWTFERYQQWLDTKTDWVVPEPPSVLATMKDDVEFDDLDPAHASPPRPKRSAGTRTAVSAKAPAIDDANLDFDTPTSTPARRPNRPAPALSTYESDDALETGLSPGVEVSAARTSRHSRRGSGANDGGKMKIHKDGRIEIPDLDLDLNEIIKEFRGRDEG